MLKILGIIIWPIMWLINNIIQQSRASKSKSKKPVRLFGKFKILGDKPTDAKPTEHPDEFTEPDKK